MYNMLMPAMEKGVSLDSILPHVKHLEDNLSMRNGSHELLKPNDITNLVSVGLHTLRLH